jgi:7-carboxy-7-deazaguanine synthase
MSQLLSDRTTSPLAAEDLARRLKPLAAKPAGTLLIHEIYRSIQGESQFAGWPCVFVRLTACHLRCSYCDTPHAFHSGEVWSVDQVLDKVRELGDPLVELTGGEPLLQPEALPLLSSLADLGKIVLLETSGATSIENVDPRAHIILDVKTPASNESHTNIEANYDRLKASDEVKYVICDHADFVWSVDHALTHALIDRTHVVFSPAFGLVDPSDLAHWILDTKRKIRLQLQLHKQLWHPQARGV